MIWPTPYQMTTKLFVGDKHTRLELPVIPPEIRKTPKFRRPEPREQRPDARSLGGESWPHGIYELKHDLWSSTVSVVWEGTNDFEIQERRYFTYEKNYFETNNTRPEESRFRGEAGHRIELKDRKLYLRTTINLSSDKKNFFVTFVREIFENNVLVRKREWKEMIPRTFH